MSSVRSTQERVDVDLLCLEFEDPLGSPSIATVEVDSAKAASLAIERLSSDLGPKASWKVRLDGLERCIAMLKGGIQYYPGGNLVALAPMIASCLTDLRSGTVKQAALLVTAEARSLGSDFAPSFAAVFPALVKQLQARSALVANCCHLAILEIVRSCQSQKVAKPMLDGYKSPVPCVRLVAAEAAHVICETWQPNKTQPLNGLIQAVLAKLVNDPCAVVRSVAGEAMSVPRLDRKTRKTPPSTLGYFPPPTKDMRPMTGSPGSPSGRSSRVSFSRDGDSVVSGVGRADEEQAGIVERKIVFKDVNDLMPPCSDKEAALFKRELDKLVDDEELDVLKPSVAKIAESVVRAAALVSERDYWEDDLEAVLEKYPKCVRGHEMKLMEAFGFEIWIVEMIGRYVSLQELAEGMTFGNMHQLQNGVKFFTSVLQIPRAPVEKNDKIQETLELLVKKCAKTQNVEVLERAIGTSAFPASIAGILDVITESLTSGNSEWQGMLETLEARYDGSEGSKTIIREQFAESLRNLFEEGTDKRKEAIIDFVTSAAQRLKGASFIALSETLMDFLVEDHPKLHEKALDCLSKMLADVEVMANVMNMLKEASEYEAVGLEALCRYFAEAPPPRLLATQKIIRRAIGPFLSSKDVSIRKFAVGIFAEFRKKIPKEFSSQMERLNATQRKLIELSAAKTAKSP